MSQAKARLECRGAHLASYAAFLRIAARGRGQQSSRLQLGPAGDAGLVQIPAIKVDNTLFSLIGGAGVRVPTTAVIPDQLVIALPGNLLGPYAAEAPGTELVRPRMTQVLPTKYTASLVHRDGVSPATAYHELYGMFEADKVLEDCADVLAWLGVAFTARCGAGELEAVPAGVAQTFSLLMLPAAVSKYVAAKVYRDLPAQH